MCQNIKQKDLMVNPTQQNTYGTARAYGKLDNLGSILVASRAKAVGT